MMPARSDPIGALLAVGVALSAVLLASPRMAADQGPTVAPGAAVKAAFLYNFAKFVEWPELRPGAPIVTCIVGDEAMAAAFVETVRSRQIDGHGLPLQPAEDVATWPSCCLLFIGEAGVRRSAVGLQGLTSLPVLTVSDDRGFSMAGAIIALYVEDGRMRFSINIDAAERSGLRLSSRLLGLATIVRDGKRP